MDWDDIYIDTNIFLDFYQTAIDRLGLFRELVKRANRVILTEQTILEFRRNRTARLAELARNIEKTSDIQIHTTSLVREFSDFDEWVKAKDKAKEHAKAIVKRLRTLIQDESSDPVYQEFTKLVSAATTFRTTPEAIGRASTRKQLGNPPTSPDKYTIGDELIWETLLDNCDHNLIVVSRDRSYLDNVGLLAEEFERVGFRKLLLITDSLGAALKKVGEPSKEIAEVERLLNVGFQGGNAELESDRCSICSEQLEMDYRFDDNPFLDGCQCYYYYCPSCDAAGSEEPHGEEADSEEADSEEYRDEEVFRIADSITSRSHDLAGTAL